MPVIAGHGRVEAAKLLKIERVSTLRLSHLSDAERRAYVLAEAKGMKKISYNGYRYPEIIQQAICR